MMKETARKLDQLESLIDDEFGVDDERDQDGIFCDACNKAFKSQKQYEPKNERRRRERVSEKR